MDITRIAPEVLHDRLGDPEIIIIDVRRDREQASARIPGAALEHPDEIDRWEDHYPKDKHIILYCSEPEEHISAGTARKLFIKGFPLVFALAGGWRQWQQEGYPTEPL